MSAKKGGEKEGISTKGRRELNARLCWAASWSWRWKRKKEPDDGLDQKEKGGREFRVDLEGS